MISSVFFDGTSLMSLYVSIAAFPEVLRAQDAQDKARCNSFESALSVAFVLAVSKLEIV